jgi:hypothetical protein
VRGQADKKVVAKHLLDPMAEEGNRMISNESKVIALDSVPALISFRKKTELQKGLGAGEGGSVVGRHACRGLAPIGAR